MIWYDKFEIYYLFNDIPIWLLSIFIYRTLWTFSPSISYTIHDLVALGVIQNIQVASSLQVGALFIRIT